jgi:hypothetical protein
VDVVLVGGGILSATLDVLLSEGQWTGGSPSSGGSSRPVPLDDPEEAAA